jgi:hypothetical protein
MKKRRGIPYLGKKIFLANWAEPISNPNPNPNPNRPEASRQSLAEANRMTTGRELNGVEIRLGV